MKLNSFIHSGKVTKALLLANCLMAFIYYLWWFDTSHISNAWAYGLLFFGETYHIMMAYLFWFTVWPKKRRIPINPIQTFTPSVDIFITVANEPLEIIRATALAAKRQIYPNAKVYLLNDGYVAKRPDWIQVEVLARELGIFCLTRTVPGGAKAGNINHALRQTTGEIIVIFDADMAAVPHFLNRMLPYFTNPKIAFVQSPQYYENHKKNDVAQAAWEQQELFYGPIMRGKDNYNSAFICGTNVAIRRFVLESIGGMVEESITEDFLTSIRIHQKGYQSIYIPEVLASGLAPEDLLSYYKQQRRWARGSLEALFRENPFFMRGLTMDQRWQYFTSALYYLNGLVILIDMMMPLLFFFFGIKPVTISTTNFAFYFIPFMFLNLLTLYMVSGKNVTFRALAFSQSSFMLQLSALLSAITGRNDTFTITSKKALSGNFVYLAYPHIFYIVVAIIGVIVALHREGFTPSVMTNMAWTFFNITLFYPYIKASLSSTEDVSEVDKKVALQHSLPRISGV
ncbi:MAG: glycosyltransferase [Candidatus Levyibacteriota bacterium]